jgi:CheY-like chemotaxis protein
MPHSDRPYHILIVDDDVEIRRLLGDYLERHGLRATAVGGGKGLWQALAGQRVDLVVLDLMLPGEDGLTLCRTLRAQSEVPVIMLTALGDEMDRKADAEDMGQEVRFEGADLPPYSAHPMALKRCIANLIDNAVKYGRRASVCVTDYSPARRCAPQTGPWVTV